MFGFLDTKVKKKQLSICYSVFLFNGMLALSIGSMLPFIRDARGLDYAFAGMIVSLHSVGNFLSSFFAGPLAIALGRKKSILIFESALPIAYAILLFSKSPWLIALAFLLSGLARGACSNFSNAMVNQLAPGKAAVLNGLHAMFSVGAFVFPIILTVLTATNSANWILACGMMLVLGCIAWVLYSMFPVEETAAAAKTEKKVDYRFFKEPLFYLCTGTLFFYLCAEQGVIGWMITYFKDAGIMSASLSQLMASVLWIMILAGRLTVAALSNKVKKENLLLGMGIGFVLFFLILLFSRNTAVIVLGILGFGYSMAGIYPTTVSFAGKLISKYSMAWSFILTFASMGSILMPSIIGKIAESAGIVSGMSSVVVVVAIDLILILALRRYIKKNQ